MSAAFDYSGLAATATSLITRFGRPMTLARATRVPSGSKPWLTQQGAASASAAQSVPTVGVFISLDREGADLQTATSTGSTVTTTVERKLGQVLIRTEALLPEEVGSDWQLVDGTRTYEVILSRPLKPGPVLMLYKLTVVL